MGGRIMGLIQKKLEEVKKNIKIEVEKIKKPKEMGGGTADEILEDESEVERLSKYIDPAYKKKIIDQKSGIKYGVNKIGTKGDSAQILGFQKGQLFYGASQKAKKKAAKTLVNIWAKNNLTEIIKTKTKNIIGKQVNEDTYIKMVNYVRGGKQIQYLQARSISTGKIVALKQAMKLL